MSDWGHDEGGDIVKVFAFQPHGRGCTQFGAHLRVVAGLGEDPGAHPVLDHLVDAVGDQQQAEEVSVGDESAESVAARSDDDVVVLAGFNSLSGVTAATRVLTDRVVGGETS
ncbi:MULTISPECIES: hypothetical protein [unclassified Crossiella]|uniref:hypothetical protein n=1 Tax=unclassified Crossiella TaxID=2620835 RepID=UPI001FFE5A06|nr:MULTISPECIES: hypothetical protein [unclassified Crossiella]MCK2245440.1 hypothetical protein [Crossiella sp. S99.2]MCK2259092.1 hypothetical protein [Crossiella sp. S99.1]